MNVIRTARSFLSIDTPKHLAPILYVFYIGVRTLKWDFRENTTDKNRFIEVAIWLIIENQIYFLVYHDRKKVDLKKKPEKSCRFCAQAYYVEKNYYFNVSFFLTIKPNKYSSH